MFKKIEKLKLNILKSDINKDPILKNNFSTSFTFIVSLMIFILSYFTFSKNIILDNMYIKFLIEYFMNIFPSFESRALIAQENNLYSFSKFQNLVSIFNIGFIILVLFPPILKVYLCSLNIFKCNNLYINETIKRNGSRMSFFQYIIVFLWIIFLIYFFFYQEFNSHMLISLKSLFNTKIGITLFSFGFSFIIGLFSIFLILETIFKFYKIIGKIRNKGDRQL